MCKLENRDISLLYRSFYLGSINCEYKLLKSTQITLSGFEMPLLIDVASLSRFSVLVELLSRLYVVLRDTIIYEVIFLARQRSFIRNLKYKLKCNG
jgi:hypothetical protein